MFKTFGLGDATQGWLAQVRASRELQHVLRSNEAVLASWGLSADLTRALDREERRVHALIGRVDVVKKMFPARLFSVIKFYLGGNYQYFLGWKSALKDLIR